MTRLAINGFGRIGRTAVRVLVEKQLPNLELVAINTSGSMEIEAWAHLLKYDTAYGKFLYGIKTIHLKDAGDTTDNDPCIGQLMIDGLPSPIPVLAQRDPSKLPWKDYRVDVVIESTGVFTSEEKAKAHLAAGAKRVLISAPPKGGGIQTIVLGVNDGQHGKQIEDGIFETIKEEPDRTLVLNLPSGDDAVSEDSEPSVSKKYHQDLPPTESNPDIISNASCTTNCVAPVAAVLHAKFGISKAALLTIHGYTDDQNLQDNSHRDLRRARAAAQNLVPTTTGAAISVTETIPELKGLFDGIAIRAPVITGSLSDITCILKKIVTKEEVNQTFIEASKTPRWQGILAVTDEPLVSSDIIGRPESAIVDLTLTQVVGGNLVKILAWYDNEYGYCHRLIEQTLAVGLSLSS